MRNLGLLALPILGVGCAATEAADQPSTRGRPTTETPALPDLTDKVVLLEMWTFGCINCQRVIPHIQARHEAYAEQGLVVIGNHYPEFAHERDVEALREAVGRLGVTYPVAQDTDGATRRAYRNRYWPTLHLIDQDGRLRYQHIGEGAYAETEAAIRALLAEANS